MKKMGKVVALLLSVFMVFSLWGCSASQQTNAGGSSKAAASGKTIALIPPAMISPYYAAVINGAKKTASDLGYNLETLAPSSESDYAAQVQIVEDEVTKKVSGIILCAINADAIVSAVKKANAANIPVIMFNAAGTLSSGTVASYVNYDQYESGKKDCDFVAQQFNGKAKVAIIEGLPSDQTTQRENGFKDEAKAKYPNIQVVATQPGDWEREKGMNAASNMLQAHPDTDVILALCDEMGLGAVEAIKQANSKAKVVSMDGNPNAIASIEAGEMLATVYAASEQTGTVCVKTMDSILKGEKVDNTIKVDTTLVTKDNAKNFPDK